MRECIDLILEGLQINRLTEGTSGDYISFGKVIKGLSEKDCLEISSHIWLIDSKKEVSLNTKEFEGLVVDIEGVSNGVYNLVIRKNKNKPWDPYRSGWTSTLKKWGILSYNNGYFLSGFKTSQELKNAIKSREDSLSNSKKELFNRLKEVVKKDLGFYDNKYDDYFVFMKVTSDKSIKVKYDDEEESEVSFDYITSNTNYEEVLDEMDMD